jgi:hypothetical protein
MSIDMALVEGLERQIGVLEKRLADTRLALAELQTRYGADCLSCVHKDKIQKCAFCAVKCESLYEPFAKTEDQAGVGRHRIVRKNRGVYERSISKVGVVGDGK